MTALVDKSVLAYEGQGAVAQYRLLGAIRAFGQEKARQACDQAALRRRYRDWCRHRALGEPGPQPRAGRQNDPCADSPAGPSGGAPVAWATSLTRREREVADLVARGMTNRQIALRLVIAQRTAEGHVESIMAKLGVTSRTQIALWSARQARSGRRTEDG